MKEVSSESREDGGGQMGGKTSTVKIHSICGRCFGEDLLEIYHNGGRDGSEEKKNARYDKSSQVFF